MHNVFPGNTLSSDDLPFSKEIEEEEIEISVNKASQISAKPSFKAKMVPFSRAKDALKSLEQDLEIGRKKGYDLRSYWKTKTNISSTTDKALSQVK